MLIVSNTSSTDKPFTVRWGSQAFFYALPSGTVATFTWNGTQQNSTTPANPTNLKVRVSDDQLILNWEFSPLADSYTIKRADTPGGPYTIIATGIGVPEYFDTQAISGNNYSYVVSAVNALGESSDSAESSATP